MRRVLPLGTVGERQLTDILCVLRFETEAAEMIPGMDKDTSINHNRDVNLSSRSPLSTSAAAYHRGAIVSLATDTVDLFLLPLALGLLLSRTNAVLFCRNASSRFCVRRYDDLVCGSGSGGPPCRPRRPTRRDGTRILRHARKK